MDCLLIVWPDDRYTLQLPASESDGTRSRSISAREADEIICTRILSSEQGLLGAGLTGAFLRAAEGLRALGSAEHEMQEELVRRDLEREERDRVQGEES